VNIQSARLEVIFDGMLAQIVFSSGEKSRVFITKNQALQHAELLIGEKITVKEWCMIASQIENSPLFEENKGLEDYCDQMQSDLESLIRTLRKYINQEENEGEEWKKNS
jgi:DNA-binding transcriptional regulator GbsR (MarR family)